MKALPDLFPETLIVSMVHGQPMTSSLLIAEHFGKRHDNVVRAIRTYIARAKGPGRLLNFEESSYLNDQGKRQPMYLLTKDGFYFVAGKFTGEQADEWQWRFIDCFNAMEAALHAQTQREAEALYKVRPRWRPIAQNPQLSRKELIALTGHTATSSITACRKKMREAGALGIKPGVKGQHTTA